jgi:CelD/BcsL family acetyltransferase involved in cellulose biosynthesis
MDEMTPLRAAWDELLAHYPSATTFSTWEWLASWWECFGKKRKLLALALFDSGTLIGLALFSLSVERSGILSLRTLRMLGDGSGDSDNLDFPVKSGYEAAFAEAILECLGQRERDWDVCLLNTLPTTSPVAEHLARLLSLPKWIAVEYSSNSSAVHLPETWELYQEMLSSEDRKNLTRYTLRLQRRYATRFFRCAKQEEVSVCLEALFRLHQERWRKAGEAGTFSNTDRRDFYEVLSRRLLARGVLELWALELDGEIAAVQFAFRHGERVIQLQEGYDPTRTADRPGYVLRSQVLKQLIADGIRIYDFLGGEDSYKRRWAAHQGKYRRLHFASPLSLGSMYLQFVDKSGKSKEWMREALPASVWKLLHKVNVAVRSAKLARPTAN